MNGATDIAVWVLQIVLLVYFVVLTTVSSALTLIGWKGVNDYVRRRPLRAYEDVATSELSMPVSIIVPAHDEQETIVESVRTLLGSQFSQFEIIVVNDGSTDETVDRLVAGLDMVAMERVPSEKLPSEPVRSSYRSRVDHRVILIDKAQGGKPTR